ncbi:MAG: M24 family metallopeptidase [Bacillota bacterium]
MLNQTRVTKLQQLAQREQLTAFVVAPSASMFYLAGFTMGLSERPAFLVVPAGGESFFCCPSFEADRVQRSSGITDLLTYTDEVGPGGLVPGLKERLRPGRIAFEFRSCRLLEYDVVAQAVDLQLVDARPYLAELRMAKDEVERTAMQRAADAVNALLDGIKDALTPGVTEQELLAAGVARMKQEYPDAKLAFGTVLVGERTAMPHASTGDQALQPGDLVIADVGAMIDGYVSDITRTFATGTLSDQLNQAYDLVLAANAAARAAAKPGMTAKDLDEIARRVIRDGGFGPQFSHRLGHGLGLEVHEEPYIVASNDQILKPGHAFTIEPGIYLPGTGGIRVEDDVILTQDGVHVLTSYPRDLRA